MKGQYKPLNPWLHHWTVKTGASREKNRKGGLLARTQKESERKVSVLGKDTDSLCNGPGKITKAHPLFIIVSSEKDTIHIYTLFENEKSRSKEKQKGEN